MTYSCGHAKQMDWIRCPACVLQELDNSNLQNEQMRKALKEIAGFPPLSSSMKMQNVADEALHLVTALPDDDSPFPTAHDLKIMRAVDEFNGACKAHRMTDCRTCAEQLVPASGSCLVCGKPGDYTLWCPECIKSGGAGKQLTPFMKSLLDPENLHKEIKELLDIIEKKDLQAREMASALGFAKDAIASAWAALGDNMESQSLGGKGIEKPYAHQVQSELRAAGERISVVLSKVENRKCEVALPLLAGGHKMCGNIKPCHMHG
jgi:hypothetical protein